MNGYNFTERVRKILASARNEALRRGHLEVTPEHIALGLIAEDDGVACAVLQKRGVASADVRSAIEAQLPAAAPTRPDDRDLPYTSVAKRVLERSMAEARELHHSYVGTEHLLLALVHESAGATSEIFAQHGLTHDKATSETLRLLGPNKPT